MELSKKVKDLVMRAIEAQNNKQKKDVKKEASKLYKKEKLRPQLQFGQWEGLSLVSFAAREGHQFLLKTLVECCHANPIVPDAILNTTPLHHAAGAGQLGMMDILVGELSCPIDVVDSCGSTPLYLAIIKGKTSSVIKLIDFGASVEANNFFGAPLHVAAFTRNLDVVLRLREKSPQVIDRELYGFCTPIVAALCGDSGDLCQCVEYLAKFSTLGTQSLAYKVLICTSTEDLALKCMDSLLKNGMDPNSHDEVLMEEIPILFAAKLRWRKVVELLLPQTNQLHEVAWTVDGLIEHVDSDQFKAMELKKKETRIFQLRSKCVEELRNRNYLAACYILKGLKGCKMSKASPPVLVSEADDEDEDDEDGDDEDEDDEDGDDDDEDEDEDEEDYNKDGEDQEKDREGRRLKQVPDDCERDCKKPKLAEGVEFHGEA